jgi:hypothetical protein
MNCHQVQLNLSLYLYGELEFAQEEALERHLDECALCELALAREKAWHTSINAEKKDVPFDLLAGARQALRNAVHLPRSSVSARSLLAHWMDRYGFSASGWSFRLAAASFLVFIGFSLGQFVNKTSDFAGSGNGISEMGLLNPATSHVRDIEPGNDGRVRIIFDQVRQGQVVGQADSSEVRRLLLAATRDAADPGVQVDSVNILKDQDGDDVRDALLDVAQHDSNAGVRLKALEALQRFSGDPATRQGVMTVLAHDSNPGVRSQAINLLAPATEKVEFSPELADTLQQVMRSQEDDDYLNMRCMQILQEMGAPVNVY